MTTFIEVTEERFYEMLDVLPPIYAPIGWMVGEACDHCPETGRPRYDAFVEWNGKFYGSDGPMTLKDFRTISWESFPKLIQGAAIVRAEGR
jgi:hypothetical protein